MKKKILICGVSGFIGRNLFNHLSQRPDLEICGTYLRKYFPTGRLWNLWRADLTDRNHVRALLKDRHFDCIINAAAITDGSGAVASEPGKYITDNIRINNNLIEGAHENSVPHFIFLSCSVVYPANNTSPAKEADVDVKKIHSVYVGAKIVKLPGEDLCNFYSSLEKTRFTIVRHSNNYGPYDKFDTAKGHVFAATVAKVMSPENDKVVVWGGGNERRDLLHISDLVRFLEMTLNYGNRYDVFNVGSGRSISVRELVEKINSISGRNLPIHYDLSRSSIDTNIILDIAKAKKVMGWQPHVDIDEGIRQTIDWYLKNKGGRDGK